MPNGSSNAEQLMSALDRSSAETAPKHTTTSSTDYPKALLDLDLGTLTPRSQAISLLIAEDLSDGHSLAQLADELGLSPSSVSNLLQELRLELELQTSAVPPLTDDEYQTLKDSIEKDGVHVPIVIGERGLIDGRHRWRASRELGLKDIPAVFLTGLTEEQEHDAAVQINTVRRQLTREQKRALIRAEINRDPARSSRQIAQLCGVTHPTVESVRAEIRREAEVAPSPEEIRRASEFIAERVDSIGRPYQVKERPKPLTVEKQLGYVTCGRCEQRHALWRDGGSYRIETV